MKTFTATQLNKSPQEVFAAVKEDGSVLIEHDRYSGVFSIVWHPTDATKEDKLNCKHKNKTRTDSTSSNISAVCLDCGENLYKISRY